MGITMSENKLVEQSIVIPAFHKATELHLSLTKTREGESRLLEARMANPITYSELECVYNQAYRELKTNLAIIGDLLNKADNDLEIAKSNFLIDSYQEKIKDLPKSHDSADLRKAWLMRDAAYLAAKDRVDMLKAMEALLDGKIKVFERTCAYMKKQMDLVLRSGLSGSNLYSTNRK
jgi:hypothetical protein